MPRPFAAYQLPTLGFRDQLQAGRLARRWLQLVVGLAAAASRSA